MDRESCARTDAQWPTVAARRWPMLARLSGGARVAAGPGRSRAGAADPRGVCPRSRGLPHGVRARGDRAAERGARRDRPLRAGSRAAPESSGGDDRRRSTRGSGSRTPRCSSGLVVVRLFYDHLIEERRRDTNPVGRGRYTPGSRLRRPPRSGLGPALHQAALDSHGRRVAADSRRGARGTAADPLDARARLRRRPAPGGALQPAHGRSGPRVSHAAGARRDHEESARPRGAVLGGDGDAPAGLSGAPARAQYGARAALPVRVAPQPDAAHHPLDVVQGHPGARGPRGGVAVQHAHAPAPVPHRSGAVRTGNCTRSPASPATGIRRPPCSTSTCPAVISPPSWGRAWSTCTPGGGRRWPSSWAVTHERRRGRAGRARRERARAPGARQRAGVAVADRSHPLRSDADAVARPKPTPSRLLADGARSGDRPRTRRSAWHALDRLVRPLADRPRDL